MTPKSGLRSTGVLVGLLLLALVQLVIALGGWMNADLLRLGTGVIAALLGVVGAVAAFTAFSGGDYMRRIWLLLALNSTFLLISTLLMTWMQRSGVPLAQSPLLPVRLVVVILANTMMASALILLALTYRRSGLSPEATWRSRLLWAASLVVAVLVVLPEVRHNLELFRSAGDNSGLLAAIGLISTTGDLFTIALIVPILRVAYMLRGGTLAAVWWSIAASGAMWLIYDARGWLSELFIEGASGPSPVMFVFRTLALGMLGVAGFFQRDVVTSGPAAAGPGRAAA